MLRLALQGKTIRFVFDRPRAGITLSEGLDRKSPGVFLEVGFDLATFAQRPDIAHDGAISAQETAEPGADSRQRRARSGVSCETCPPSPLKRGFLIERAACVVAPLGLDEVVRASHRREQPAKPSALNFALQIVQTLKETLQRRAARSILICVWTAPRAPGRALRMPRFAPEAIRIRGKLHACSAPAR